MRYLKSYFYVATLGSFLSLVAILGVRFDYATADDAPFVSGDEKKLSEFSTLGTECGSTERAARRVDVMVRKLLANKQDVQFRTYVQELVGATLVETDIGAVPGCAVYTEARLWARNTNGVLGEYKIESTIAFVPNTKWLSITDINIDPADQMDIAQSQSGS